MSNKLKPYEYIDESNQVLCKLHERMVCAECEYEYVKGLETEIKYMKDIGENNYLAYQEKLTQIEELDIENRRLNDENKRHQEVLEFYGNKNNYIKYVGMQPITPTIEIDSGKKAREILKQ